MNSYYRRHKTISANFTTEQAEQIKQLALDDGETASHWLQMVGLAALKERADERFNQAP